MSSQSILRRVHEGFGKLGESGSELGSSFSLRLASHLIAHVRGELAPESCQAARCLTTGERISAASASLRDGTQGTTMGSVYLRPKKKV